MKLESTDNFISIFFSLRTNGEAKSYVMQQMRMMTEASAKVLHISWIEITEVEGDPPPKSIFSL